jgi:hypothetical protein
LSFSEVEGAGRDDLGKGRVLPRVAVEQADVVSGRAHARSVKPGRCGHPGVAPAELACQVVDLGHRGVHPAQLHGQGVCGVVSRVHEQPVQDVADRIVAALADADLGAFRARVLRGARNHFVHRQFPQRLGRHQHLDDAGRAVPAMRILGRDDVAAIQVGD